MMGLPSRIRRSPPMRALLTKDSTSTWRAAHWCGKMLLTRTDVGSASARCVRAPPWPARSGRDRLDDMIASAFRVRRRASGVRARGYCRCARKSSGQKASRSRSPRPQAEEKSTRRAPHGPAYLRSQGLSVFLFPRMLLVSFQWNLERSAQEAPSPLVSGAGVCAVKRTSKDSPRGVLDRSLIANATSPAYRV